MAKITDPSKLLPSAKSTAITKIGKANFTSPLKISKKSTSIAKGLLGESNQKDAVDVNNKLVKVEKFFQSDLLVSKKKAETKRKEKEKEEFKKEEEKLEAPKEAKKFNLPSLSLPGMSFLDRIKRFLFFTALGWLFTKFQDQLPKLLGVVKLISGVYGVVENTFKFLLSSFVNFVERGYDAYDKIRGIAKSIGGEKAQKDFDNLSGKLNEYINYALIGGMALTGAIDAFGKEINKGKGGGTSPGRGASSGGNVGIGGKGAGRSRVIDPSVARRYADRYGRGAATRKFGGEGVRSLGGRYGRSGASNLARKGAVSLLGKGGTKAVLKFTRPFLKRLPLIGALIDFGLSVAMGEPLGRAAFKAIGAGILGAIGTGFGGPLGAIIGGFAGDWAGGKLYDIFFGNKKPQGKVQRTQGGGSVTRGGKPQGRGPSRTLKISKRRPPKIKPKQSQPGKDVGGKKKIRQLYPDPSVRTDIEGEQNNPWFNLLPAVPKLKDNATDDEKKEYQRKVDEREQRLKKLPNPYKALTNAAKVLKDIPFGIGALMGGAVDIALGQKLPKDAIKGLSGGISYLITSIANRQISASISNIEKEVSKMQAGGVVRARDFTKGSEVGPGEGITKALDNLVYQKVDEAIREVQKQLMPGKYDETKPGTIISDEVPPPPGGTVGPDGAPVAPGPGGTAGIPGTPGPGGAPSGAPGSSTISKTPFAKEINEASKISGIPASQITAMMEIESGFDPRASSGYANGLMQIAPATYKELYSKYGKKYSLKNDIYDPRTSAVLGSLYMRDLYNGPANKSVETMVKMYNAGPAGNLQGKEPTNHWKKFQGAYGKAQKNETSAAQQAPSTGAGTGGMGQLTPSSVFGVQEGKSKVSQDIENFRKFRTQFGGPAAKTPTAEPEYYQIREMGVYGSGNYQISPLADDTNYEINVHRGAGHWENRAFDIPVPVRSKEGDAVADYWRSKGYTVIWKDGGSHDNHVHVEVPSEKASEWFKIIKNAGTLAMKDGKEGIIENGIWKPKTWTAEEKARYKNQPSNIFKQDQKPKPSGIFTKPASTSTPSNIFDWNKKQDGGVIPKQSPNRNVSSLRSYPSYADGGMMIAIQPMIIEKPVPVPMGRGGGISFPVAGVNNSTGNTPSLSKG